MGLKKIAELRKELEKQADALEKFTDASKEFAEAHAKIAAAHDQVEKLRKANLVRIQALPTLGMKEFEHYKKSLESIYSEWGRTRPLPLGPLKAVVDQQRKAVDAAVQERIAKLAASFPSQVKPGMVFRFEPTKALWEITSEGEEATNASLKGDDRIWFKHVDEGGKPGDSNLTTLKKRAANTSRAERPLPATAVRTSNLRAVAIFPLRPPPSSAM